MAINILTARRDFILSKAKFKVGDYVDIIDSYNNLKILTVDVGLVDIKNEKLMAIYEVKTPTGFKWFLEDKLTKSNISVHSKGYAISSAFFNECQSSDKVFKMRKVEGEDMGKCKTVEFNDTYEQIIVTNRRVVTLLYYKLPDGEKRYSRGVSICSKEDTFDESFGRALSMKRALEHKTATYSAYIFDWYEKRERFKIG